MSNDPLASDLTYSLIKSLRANSVAGGIVLNPGQFDQMIKNLTSIMEIARNAEEYADILAEAINGAIVDPVPVAVLEPSAKRASADILPLRRKRQMVVLPRPDGGDAA